MKNDFRDYLCHYGIKGMKWGVRRYQNPDGSLTEEGKSRYRLRSNHIKRGQIVYRATNSNKSNFMNRAYAYVSITDDYSEHNKNTSEGFEGRFNYDYVMKTKKPLKIASIKDYYMAVKKANNLKTKNIKKLHKYIEGDGGNNKYFNNAIAYLSKLGYDGVRDPIDYHDENSTAAIIFNPKQNLSIQDIYER